MRVVALAVLAAGGLTWWLLAGDAGDARAQEGGPVARGQELYLVGCSSCHGVDGQGLRDPNGELRGPSLANAGEASAYYYLQTGRMPLADPEQTPQNKEPAYAPEEIEALVAYVGTLGEGARVPTVDPAAGGIGAGGVLYRNNCQACHSATGAGGALSYGRAAPTLQGIDDPAVVGSAIRVGPGQMPRFSRETFDDEEVDSIAAYVAYLQEPDDRGGLALGRLGPIPEGFLVWVVGIGALLLTARWIGTRSRRSPATQATSSDPPTTGD